MYSVGDLFDRRSVVGIRLEKIIIDRGYTKVEISKKVGVSRPTLDKLLTGTSTSKINYEKHMAKIMEYLSISADMLLGNMKNKYIRTREISNLMKVSSKEIAKATGIPLTRLMEIDAGENATLAELRDIAMCLSVSVKCLLGENFFEPQIATLDLCICNSTDENRDKYSGFWGHIGIQLCNSKEFLWYPITGNTRKLVYRMIESDRIVIPCMNNKVLFVNMKNVNEIVFSDFDCDQPEFINWNNKVDCGEVPLVVYEVLEDYCYLMDEGSDEDVLSPQFQSFMKEFIEKKGLSEDEIYEETQISIIYYLDGCVRPVSIDFKYNESISGEIYNTYVYEDTEFADDILFCQDIAGTQIIFNMKNVSMLELPLLSVEEAIREYENEIINEE